MKTLDVILIIFLIICFFAALYFTLKNKGRCSGNCKSCNTCSQKYVLNKIIKQDYGICSYNSVKDSLIKCRNIEKIPENAKSIIMLCFPYKVRSEKPENICRYAAVPDYHTVVNEMLEDYAEKLRKKYPQNKFVCFADNSPIPEVAAANKAGLGVKGQNGLLITEKYGSFVFLGEIVTDKTFPADKPKSGCVNCGKCKESCPVMLSKGKCLSAVTQKKGELGDDEKALVKKYGCVWGCDICAEVCPMNEKAEVTDIKPFVNGYRNKYEKGEDIKGRAYAWRGEKTVSRNADILKEK